MNVDVSVGGLYTELGGICAAGGGSQNPVECPCATGTSALSSAPFRPKEGGEWQRVFPRAGDW